MLARILQGILDALAAALNGVISVLPTSPFAWEFSWLGEWWSVVNYFIPFQAMASLTMCYVAAVAIWYGVRWVFRFVRYIG